MENDVLLYALESAIRGLRKHQEYGLIKTIYEGLKSHGFDITKKGGSEAEQCLRMWLTYSFTAAVSKSKDEDIKNFAQEVLDEIRRSNKSDISLEYSDFKVTEEF